MVNNPQEYPQHGMMHTFTLTDGSISLISLLVDKNPQKNPNRNQASLIIHAQTFHGRIRDLLPAMLQGATATIVNLNSAWTGKRTCTTCVLRKTVRKTVGFKRPISFTPSRWPGTITINPSSSYKHLYMVSSQHTIEKFQPLEAHWFAVCKSEKRCHSQKPYGLA